MTTPATLYKKLIQVIPDLPRLKEYRKLKANGYMDLNVDVLVRAGNTMRIAIAHNYEMNGDIVPDPDMELEVDLKMETVDAKTVQNIYAYSEVEEGDVMMQKDLNEFLDLWLTNLIDQGHK